MEVKHPWIVLNSDDGVCVSPPQNQNEFGIITSYDQKVWIYGYLIIVFIFRINYIFLIYFFIFFRKRINL